MLQMCVNTYKPHHAFADCFRYLNSFAEVITWALLPLVTSATFRKYQLHFSYSISNSCQVSSFTATENNNCWSTWTRFRYLTNICTFVFVLRHIFPEHLQVFIYTSYMCVSTFGLYWDKLKSARKTWFIFFFNRFKYRIKQGHTQPRNKATANRKCTRSWLACDQTLLRTHASSHWYDIVSVWDVKNPHHRTAASAVCGAAEMFCKRGHYASVTLPS